MEFHDMVFIATNMTSDEKSLALAGRFIKLTLE
jgi:hypothetical protein